MLTTVWIAGYVALVVVLLPFASIGVHRGRWSVGTALGALGAAIALGWAWPLWAALAALLLGHRVLGKWFAPEQPQAQRAEARVQSTLTSVWRWKIKARIALIGAVALVDVGLIRQLSPLPEPAVRFDVIDVPAELQSRGYSSDNLARQIIDAVHLIRDSAATRMREKSIVAGAGAQETNSEIKIGIAGPTIIVPLRMLRGLSNWIARRSFVPVAGEIVIDRASHATLHVRVGSRSTSIGFDAAKGIVPPPALRQAAEFVLREADPYILASYLMGANPDRADSLLDSLSRSDNARLRAQAYVGKGNLAIDEAAAERMYRLSLRADPTYEPPYLNLGATYLRLHLNREALAIIDSTPHRGGAWSATYFLSRAVAQCELEQYREARASALASLALRDGATPESYLAIASAGFGDHDAAMKALTLAEELDPRNPVRALDRATMAFTVGDSIAFRRTLAVLLAPDTGFSRRSGMLLAALAAGTDSAVSLARHDPLLPRYLPYFIRVLSLGGKVDRARELAGAARSLIGPQDHGASELDYVMARLSCHDGLSAEADSEYSRSLREVGADRLDAAPPTALGALKACQRLGAARAPSARRH